MLIICIICIDLAYFIGVKGKWQTKILFFLSRHFIYKKGRVNSKSRIISTDEDPSLRIESSAIINLRGVSTKLNKYIVFTMQTYKKLKNFIVSFERNSKQ